jgi:hypothetical protein
VKALRQDKNEIFRAAHDASNATDYLLTLERDRSIADEDLAVQTGSGLDGSNDAVLEEDAANLARDSERIDDQQQSETASEPSTPSRYLHVFGPTTAASFAHWAGIRPAAAKAVFQELFETLTPVRTQVGDAWILAEDEPLFLAPPQPPAPARLLPSGDAFWLAWGTDRELLVPDAKRRSELWTSRVWPGALLLAGEIAGVWRRAASDISLSLWRPLSKTEREAVEAEALSLPLPVLNRPITLSFAE